MTGPFVKNVSGIIGKSRTSYWPCPSSTSLGPVGKFRPPIWSSVLKPALFITSWTLFCIKFFAGRNKLQMLQFPVIHKIWSSFKICITQITLKLIRSVFPIVCFLTVNIPAAIIKNACTIGEVSTFLVRRMYTFSMVH